MIQQIPERQSQEQDNLVKDTNIGRDLTFAPVQNIIETQIIQSSLEVVTQRKLNKNSPYQGLKRFNFKDRDRFFGRDKLIQYLSQNKRMRREVRCSRVIVSHNDKSKTTISPCPISYHCYNACYRR